jgi:hypothetical protein
MRIKEEYEKEGRLWKNRLNRKRDRRKGATEEEKAVGRGD